MATAEHRASVVRPTPLELAAFLPHASAQLQAPYRVRVQLDTQGRSHFDTPFHHISFVLHEREVDNRPISFQRSTSVRSRTR